MIHDPKAAHESRAASRRAAQRDLEARDRRLSLLRGVAAAIGVVSALLAGDRRPWAAALFGVAVLAFFVLIVLHEHVARKLQRAARRVAFHENALQRLAGNWVGAGYQGSEFLDAAHPYAIDLDLFGRASLFERLCAARTRAGQQRLADWLRAPSAIAEIEARHAASRELGPRLDLREDLAVLGAEAKTAVDSAALLRWAGAPRVEVPATLIVVASITAIAVIVSLAGWGLDWFDGTPFRLAFLAVGGCTLAGRRFSSQVLSGLGRPVQDLEMLKETVERLAAERFESARLQSLHSSLTSSGPSPSGPIGQLKRWMEFHESKNNPFFGVIAFFLVWDVQIAARIEKWRREHGASVIGWIAAVGEMEALVSLAAYAYENPEDVFPTFEPARACFHGEALAHPLLPRARAVANDLAIDDERQMLVITGSNMSGKSTMLRTVGTNAALALAGAPVRAKSLRLSPLAVAASIRVQDSLQDGASRFYAEVKRVRQVIDVAGGPVAALFLMDEIFDGTNSAERRIGAEAVVKALVAKGAIGLVTSHDLALAEIANHLAPRAANVHFEDHLEGDRMAFDYKVKPGPVTRGNAVGLMRAVGLDV